MVGKDCALCGKIIFNGEPFVMIQNKSRACSGGTESVPAHTYCAVIQGEGPAALPEELVKQTAGKLRPSFVPIEIVHGIARVREYAIAHKYKDPENWRQVEWKKYHDAMLRHVLAAWGNPRGRDPESGLLHMEHIACNIAFMLELWKEEE